MGIFNELDLIGLILCILVLAIAIIIGAESTAACASGFLVLAFFMVVGLIRDYIRRY